MTQGNLKKEIRDAQFLPFPQIYQRFQALSQKYGNMSMQNLITAFTQVTGDRWTNNNPYIQNRRVKQISSLPRDYTKDEVVEMIRKPDVNEQPLREVAHGLEYTAYPMWHLRKVYQELLTYHNYISPRYINSEDAKKDDFWREWRLLEKLREEINPAACGHQAAGQALVEGKVFYYPRISIDKAHNQVNYAFMQQLPSDWTKIVGLNNKSKYTVAFNLFYFLQPGTSPAQFGDLFIPYLEQFQELLTSLPSKGNKTVVRAGTPKCGINLMKFNKMQIEGNLLGNPEVAYENGRWFYWVTLPVDKIFTFEIDDVSRNVVSPFTGLFISMLQIAQYEQIQLELVQNPLIALITGEIPYRDDGNATPEDTYKLSNAGRQLFEALWYQMLSANNTSGIGLYMAPLENMTMHQLAEAPSSTEISANGYSYTIDKAGLGGIIPTSGDSRAGTANISFQIESRFGTPIYRSFENMMYRIFESLNLKYEWRFTMFGSVATDEQREDSARKGMTLGILSDTMTYLALNDKSLLDDLAISNAIVASGISELRLPLVSTYSAKQGDSGLPPQAKSILDPGGRPTAQGAPETEGQENDDDSYGR